MPTQHNSPIYRGDAPKLDAGSVMILRKAGALLLGEKPWHVSTASLLC